MAGNEEFMEDVEIYLEEVRRIPLLTAQEFHTLLLRAADGDEEAQLDLVNANLRLVVKIARNYTGQGVALSDLIQEGNIGLMKAVRKFATKGSTTFIEYAEECIEKAIIGGLREMNSSAQFLRGTPKHFERTRQMNELLSEVLDILTPHERKILSLRFGLEDGRARTLDEVGKIFSVGGTAIQGVEMNALGKIRQTARAAKLRDFY